MMICWKKSALSALAAIAVLVASTDAKAGMNLVTNGDFSSNGGVGELTVNTYATDWTVGPTVNGSPNPFAFIVNSQADSQGFTSAYSPPNITIWGPNSGTMYPSTNPTNPGYPAAVTNGWNGIPSPYTYALGDDGAYAAAPVSQTINNLTPGDQYTLSFQWAASQFYGYLGATTQDWQVTFGSDVVTTTTYDLPSMGFSGWMGFSETFTATSSSQTLSFLSQGSPGVPPFLLLTGVDLEMTTASVPEPSSLVIAGIGTFGVVAIGWFRRRSAAAKI